MRVKVCGITRLEDGLAAAARGAWAIGFVFWPPSPRAIDPAAAGEIAREMPLGIIRAGVFVDAGEAEILETAERAGLDAVQLHGSEPPELVRACARRFPLVMKAFRVGAGFRPEETDAYEEALPLLDARSGRAPGGTGETFDWSLAAALARRRRIVLAGGLRASNIRDAIDAVRPFAVDVSTGVESAPGVKDAGALDAFFRAVRRGDGGDR
ncbi:MAG: phosphoribosylanthranilate isomerase [Planctomycetes bacterium]|nr:phosphoribosylanthranilate isomerase [Planctomycetota bacterium]